MTWNGLAFTAAGEISGRARAGTAMGVQNTIIAVGGAAAPAAFGTLVEAAGWPAAFATLAVMPVLAWLVLGPLEGEEDERARARAARLERSASLPRPIPGHPKEAT
jgi:MFS family permease